MTRTSALSVLIGLVLTLSDFPSAAGGAASYSSEDTGQFRKDLCTAVLGSGIEEQVTDEISRRESEEACGYPSTLASEPVGGRSWERFRLEKNDRQFQQSISWKKSSPFALGYFEYIKQGQFLGNPILIRLDPPMESDSLRAVEDDLSNLKQRAEEISQERQVVNGEKSAVPDGGPNQTVNLQIVETAAGLAGKPGNPSIGASQKTTKTLLQRYVEDRQQLEYDLCSFKGILSPPSKEDVEKCDELENDFNALQNDVDEFINQVPSDLPTWAESLPKIRTMLRSYETTAARNNNGLLTQRQGLLDELKKVFALIDPKVFSGSISLDQDVDEIKGAVNLSIVDYVTSKGDSKLNATALDKALHRYIELTGCLAPDDIRHRSEIENSLKENLEKANQVYGIATGDSYTRAQQAIGAIQAISQTLSLDCNQVRAKHLEQDLALTALSNSLKNAEENKSPIKRRKYSTYLLILNYNIPAIKAHVLPVDYFEARLTTQSMLRTLNVDASRTDLMAIKDTLIQPVVNGPDSKKFGKTTSSEILSRTLDYQPVKLCSMYPRNIILTGHEDSTRLWNLVAQPSYSGFSIGSSEYQSTNELKYDVNFPKLVGIGTADGCMEWDYYPAKAAQITFGNHTAFAVIAVPSELSDSILQLNVELIVRFRVLEFLPWDLHKERISAYAPMNAALHTKSEIALFRRTFLRTLNLKMQQEIERVLATDDPVQIFAAQDGNVADTTSNQSASKASVATPPSSKAAPAKKAKTK